MADGYHSSATSPETYGERVPLIRAAAEAAGRPMPSLSARVRIEFDAPTEGARYYAMRGSSEAVAAEVRKFAALGVEDLALSWADIPAPRSSRPRSASPPTSSRSSEGAGGRSASPGDRQPRVPGRSGRDRQAVDALGPLGPLAALDPGEPDPRQDADHEAQHRSDRGARSARLQLDAIQPISRPPAGTEPANTVV